MNNYSLYLIIFCLTFIFGVENNNRSDYFSEKNIISYADHLLDTKEYRSALREYQRALYISKNSEIKNNLTIQIAYCYWKLDSISQAIEIYQNSLNEISDKKIKNTINVQLAIIYLKENQIDSSLRTIKKITINDLNEEDKNMILLIEAGIYLLKNNFQHAISLLQLHNLEENTKTKTLLNLIKNKKQKTKKNVYLSTLLSTLIPGSGKMYLNNYGDGIYSFIYTGLTTYMALNSINNENKFSVKSFIYGGLSLTLYAGNIYGTYIATKHYNKSLYIDLYNNIIDTLEI